MSFSDYTEQEKKIAGTAVLHAVQNRNDERTESNIRNIVRNMGHEYAHTIQHRRNDQEDARLYDGAGGLELLRKQIYDTLKDPDARVFQGFEANKKWQKNMPEEEKLVGQWETNSKGKIVYKPFLVTFVYSLSTGCVVIINPANSRDWGTAFPVDKKKMERRMEEMAKLTRNRNGQFTEGWNNRPDLGKHGTFGTQILQGIDKYLANRGISNEFLTTRPSLIGRFPWENIKRAFNVAGIGMKGGEWDPIPQEQLSVLQKAGMDNLRNEFGLKVNVPALLREPKLREGFLTQIEAGYSESRNPDEKQIFKDMIDASHTFLSLEPKTAQKPDLKPGKGVQNRPSGLFIQ